LLARKRTGPRKARSRKARKHRTATRTATTPPVFGGDPQGRGASILAPGGLKPLSYRQPRSHFIWTPPDPSSPVGIAWLADIHAEAELLEEDIQTILETPNLYVVLGGDMIDNHIKHLAAIVASDRTPDSQWTWLFQLLDRLAPKLVAVVSGNHENWSKALTGFDLLKFYTSRFLKVPYDADEMGLTIRLKGVSYLAAIRHRYRGGSSATPTLKVKNWWRDGDFDFDVGVICHDHTAGLEPFVRHGVTRWAVRPGTYQLDSDYAVSEGYHGALPATPVTIFKPGVRDLHSFLHLNWAAEYLKGLQ